MILYCYASIYGFYFHTYPRPEGKCCLVRNNPWGPKLSLSQQEQAIRKKDAK